MDPCRGGGRCVDHTWSVVERTLGPFARFLCFCSPRRRQTLILLHHQWCGSSGKRRRSRCSQCNSALLFAPLSRNSRNRDWPCVVSVHAAFGKHSLRQRRERRPKPLPQSCSCWSATGAKEYMSLTNSKGSQCWQGPTTSQRQFSSCAHPETALINATREPDVGNRGARFDGGERPSPPRVTHPIWPAPLTGVSALH